MRDEFGALVSADVVRNGAQAQVDADPVPRREVASRGMDQAAMKQDHRSRRACGANDAAFFVTRALNQLGDECVIYRPKGLAGGGEIVLGIDHAFFVAAGDEHQGAVECVDIV